jgi:predicted GNAT family acetyltransferase
MRIMASSYYGDEGDKFYKALENGKIVGHAGVMYDEGGQPCVHNVWVEESFRRCGLATKLMKKVIACYPNKPLHLYVNRGRSNAAAVALYNKFGFKFTSDDVEDYEMLREPKKKQRTKQ